MKLLSSTLMLGAVSAATTQQHILKNPVADHQKPIEYAAKPVSGSSSSPIHDIWESMKDMPADARAIWDEVSLHFPEAMSKASFISAPKPHTRKPDSAWDYVVKGADIQSVWVENADGEKERAIDGKLESYNLRAKKVDPAKLGVDTVKQYSGYLDDDENDKHLFYCESLR